MNPEIQQQLNELKAKITALENVAHVGFIENGKRRIVEPILGDVVRRKSSGNTAGMTQPVDEAGTALYDVAKAFDISVIVIDKNGKQYKLGVYNI